MGLCFACGDLGHLRNSCSRTPTTGAGGKKLYPSPLGVIRCSKKEHGVSCDDVMMPAEIPDVTLVDVCKEEGGNKHIHVHERLISGDTVAVQHLTADEKEVTAGDLVVDNLCDVVNLYDFDPYNSVDSQGRAWEHEESVPCGDAAVMPADSVQGRLKGKSSSGDRCLVHQCLSLCSPFNIQPSPSVLTEPAISCGQ